MFKNFNKSWFEVLVPQAAMIVVALATFFLCRAGGLEDRLALFVTFLVTLAAIAAPVFVDRTGMAIFLPFTAGVASIAICAAGIILSNDSRIVVKIVAVAIVIVIIVAFSVLTNVEDKKLSKL